MVVAICVTLLLGIVSTPGLLAAVTWGTVYPVGKHLVESGADPLWIAFARYAFALPLMLPVVLRKGTRERLAAALTPRGVLAAVFLDGSRRYPVILPPLWPPTPNSTE